MAVQKSIHTRLVGILGKEEPAAAQLIIVKKRHIKQVYNIII